MELLQRCLSATCNDPPLGTDVEAPTAILGKINTVSSLQEDETVFIFPQATNHINVFIPRSSNRQFIISRKQQTVLLNYHITTKEQPRAKTITKNTNSTQNKSETHHAKQYEVTSFLSTDCELRTETCLKNVYSLGP